MMAVLLFLLVTVLTAIFILTTYGIASWVFTSKWRWPWDELGGTR